MTKSKTATASIAFKPILPIEFITINFEEKTMNTSEKALLRLFLLEEGVIPITDMNETVSDALKKMPPEQARKLKRKYRKLWKKALAARHKGKNPFHSPNSATKKYEVFRYIMTEKVKPAIDKVKLGKVL